MKKQCREKRVQQVKYKKKELRFIIDYRNNCTNFLKDEFVESEL